MGFQPGPRGTARTCRVGGPPGVLWDFNIGGGTFKAINIRSRWSTGATVGFQLGGTLTNSMAFACMVGGPSGAVGFQQGDQHPRERQHVARRLRRRWRSIRPPWDFNRFPGRGVAAVAAPSVGWRSMGLALQGSAAPCTVLRQQSRRSVGPAVGFQQLKRRHRAEPMQSRWFTTPQTRNAASNEPRAHPM